MTEVSSAAALALMFTGMGAGALGGALGIGGGIFVAPALIFLFHLPVKWAIPASLVSVAATSLAAAPRHLRKGTVNLRVGIVLSIGAAIGGIAGGLVGDAISPEIILWVLAGAALLAALITAVVSEPPEESPVAFVGEGPDEWPGTLGGTYQAGAGAVPYEARRPAIGALISSGASLIGSIAGVGGGFINVPQMRAVMGLPVRVAASTSTFVVGLSASAALVVYLRAGRIAPAIAGPVLVGSIVGSLIGSWLQHRFRGSVLRWILVVVMVLLSIQVSWGALHG